MKVSIDIGTSFSCICRIDEKGNAEAIETQTGESIYGNKYSMPSAVFVDNDGKVIVGQAAINRRKTNPMNFKSEFKRDIGQNIPIHLGGRDFMPEDFYTEMFRHFIKCAKRYWDEEIEKAYITYPASFREAKKERIKKAAEYAGLLNVELIDEPTAAAQYCCTESNLKEGDVALVYDLGGGTFDVSVLKRTDTGFESITPPIGIPNCGGIDIDRIIYEKLYDYVKSLDEETLSNIERNEKNSRIFFSSLEETAIKIKHTLSSFDSVTESITLVFDTYDYTLTRNELNTMIASLVSQTVDCCRKILKNANVEPEKLASIFMVGGTSRIPLVQEMLEIFAPNVPIVSVPDPDLAVAQGAACNMVAPNPNISLKDNPKCEPNTKYQGTIKSAEYDFHKNLVSGQKQATVPKTKFVGSNTGNASEFSLKYDPKSRIRPVIAGYDNPFGVKSDGNVITVEASTLNIFGECNINDWYGIVSVAAGTLHTVGLKSNGTVVATGNNNSGECNVAHWHDIIAVAAGAYHTVGLKSDGTVVAVGCQLWGDVKNWKNIVAIATGEEHTVGLKSDGTVVAIGPIPYRFTGKEDKCNVNNWKNIVDITTGKYHTVGLKTDGTVIAVGINSDGQCNVNNWENIVAVAAGDSHTIGLRSDGTVVAVGDNYYGVCNVDNWRNIIAVSAGSHHTVGLKNDGTVVAVGDNGFGQLSVGNTLKYSTEEPAFFGLTSKTVWHERSQEPWKLF